MSPPLLKLGPRKSVRLIEVSNEYITMEETIPRLLETKRLNEVAFMLAQVRLICTRADELEPFLTRLTSYLSERDELLFEGAPRSEVTELEARIIEIPEQLTCAVSRVNA